MPTTGNVSGSTRPVATAPLPAATQANSLAFDVGTGTGVLAALLARRGITRIVVAELNHGQYRREIERLAQGLEVVGLHLVDGELITPAGFMEAVR